MKQRKPFVVKVLAAAALGLGAAAGCQEYGRPSSTASTDNGNGSSTPQLAAYREQAAGTKVQIAEASPDDVIAISQPKTETAQWLTVRSPAFGPNQAIPDRFTGNDGAMPPLRWSAPPAGTQSMAVIVEDPDAPAPNKPFVHMILYNIPVSTSSLSGSGNVSGEGTTTAMNLPQGAMMGENSAGTTAYVAPTPPAGDHPHGYHFQVFALDSMLDLPQGADKHQLIGAMSGHVLAKGEVVGTFKK